MLGWVLAKRFDGYHQNPHLNHCKKGTAVYDRQAATYLWGKSKKNRGRELPSLEGGSITFREDEGKNYETCRRSGKNVDDYTS